MTQIGTAIIGAGLAGLACATALRESGQSTVVFDKSRGVGGRLSTRRAEGDLRFDHGAQFVTARTHGFAALLRESEAAGQAAAWKDSGDAERIVGVPGMNAIAKHMATGLDIRLGVTVTAVERAPIGWRIDTDRGTWTCERLVVAVPAPQAKVLLAEEKPLVQEIAAVRMAPCLALMATFEEDVPVPFCTRRDPQDDLDWIALNSSKPGRDGAQTWVAHAAPDWSRKNLEETPEEIAALMLPMLCDRLGIHPTSARHVAAHRWRFARVTTALGAPFLRDGSGKLYAGGDWCLGARAENAWESGDAIARDILGLA
ncbi:NAD(P)/FAD-dependent oxidoreductase [Aliiruegeria lutimaris]|uniref:Amine oxidase domain-containing protein n=1 Tax=Aliiruegeria lutimaris TaxID=571298 RepID=A0A1G9KML9_9RHOB|nr:FAD-dependent oxidoreductase [Aliiruegeria lutimaris]SDL50717.1 hypothetical protein SAMN04488026_10905 [Aliiruegeria lutimaris]